MRRIYYFNQAGSRPSGFAAICEIPQIESRFTGLKSRGCKYRGHIHRGRIVALTASIVK